MNQDEIKTIVAQEMSNGTSLSDIQKLLVDQHNTKITFLELRMIASELEDILARMAEEEHREEELAHEKEELEKEKNKKEDVQGGTLVEVSKLARPGAIAHGTVKFGSGASAEWVFDQFGRLGLEKSEGKPTEEDIKEFQKELQKVLSGM